MDMGNGFDFGIERLTGTCLPAAQPAENSPAKSDCVSDLPDGARAAAERLKRRAHVAKKREKRAEIVLGSVDEPIPGVSESARFLSGALQEPPDSKIDTTLAGSVDAKKFYLETFGCQMNDHDSEKVAGVLMARGYSQVEKPEAANVILYNTCSIREKAAQKVFSRLGEFRERQAEGKVIGVLGCLAQQEGEEIFERAPWVSLVCGSASYRKLPQLIAELEAGHKRVTGLDQDATETFETEMTRRDNRRERI